MSSSMTDVDKDVLAAARDFVRSAFPLGDLQRALAADPLPPAWYRADELGWLSMDVTDGASIATAAAVMQEFGRHLFPGPLADTLAGRTLLDGPAGMAA